MSGIIHKTNAEDYLRSARIITGELVQEGEQVTNYLSREEWVAEARVQAQIAQAEATLYAAEQQRIANLIALAQFRIDPSELPPLRHLAVVPVDDYAVGPTQEIREGLGVS